MKDNVLAAQILDNSTKFSILDYWYVGAAALAGITGVAAAGGGSGSSNSGNGSGTGGNPSEGTNSGNGTGSSDNGSGSGDNSGEGTNSGTGTGGSDNDSTPGGNSGDGTNSGNGTGGSENGSGSGDNSGEGTNSGTGTGGSENGSGSGDNSGDGTTPGNGSGSGNKDVEEAEKALKAAQEAENTMNDLGYGRAATEAEHNAIEKAVKAYEAAKEQAEKLINNLPPSTDKTRLLNGSALLGESKDIPEVKDADGNDHPDTVDAALEALKKATETKNAIVDVKRDNPEPYTAEGAEKVNAKIDEFNTALKNAEKAVEAAKDDKKNEDNLDTKLEALGAP